MSATARKRAFLVVVAAVSTAVLIAVLTGPDDTPTTSTPSPAPTANPRQHHAPSPRPRERRTHPRDTPTRRRGRQRARAVAQDFLSAYLRYEARPTRALAPAVARLTVPGSPARALLKTPPRKAPGAPRGHVALLELHGPYRGWLKASAIVRYGRRRLLLELTLARAGGDSYRVKELAL